MKAAGSASSHAEAGALLAPPRHDKDAALRRERQLLHEADLGLPRRRLEARGAQQLREQHLRLEHGEVAADARARADRERHERGRGVRREGRRVGGQPALGQVLVGPRPEVLVLFVIVVSVLGLLFWWDGLVVLDWLLLV